MSRFFRAPDVVLIDGRLRMACLVTIMMYTNRPVTVWFDDYVTRPMYHLVERLISPMRMIGRMARFDVLPDMVRKSDMVLLVFLIGNVRLLR